LETPGANPQAYCFDLDGTLCTNTEGTYVNAKPFPDRIAKVNTLYDAGCRIAIYTARGSKTGINWADLTKQQLATWGVKYHELSFGKPYAEIYIDDKCVHCDEWFGSKGSVTPRSHAVEE
jgi:hypothetical protein